MKKATLLLVFIAAWLVMIAVYTTPARADDPIGDALATLAAATARADQIKSAQRATVAALSAESTRAALDELQRQRALTATAQAQSAQATQSALDELSRQRAATATRQSQIAESTRQSLDDLNRQRALTATAQAQSAQASATSQALSIAAQATDTALFSSANAERSERFSWGLLLVEILFVCGAAFVLWRLTWTLAAWADRMRPKPEPLFGGLIARGAATPARDQVIDAQPDAATPAEGRMPDFVQVNNDPRVVEAIDRWAERYDVDRGSDNGDK